MDALAHYRVQIGEKAASLDLGIMEEEGLLANNPSLMAKMKAPGIFTPIRSTELHALLDHFCNPALGLLPYQHCQTVVGVEIPAKIYAKGLEPASWMSQPTFRHFLYMDRETLSIPRKMKPLICYITCWRWVSGRSWSDCSGRANGQVGGLNYGCQGGMNINKPMYRYGVDSLVAVELRNWFAKKLNADIAIFDILGESTFLAVGTLAAMRSSYKQTAWSES